MTSSRLIDPLIALLLFGGTVVALGSAQRTTGVARDEGTYFQAAESYWGWFAEAGRNLKANRISDSFTRGSVGRHFRANNEHPVLFKTLIGALSLV